MSNQKYLTYLAEKEKATKSISALISKHKVKRKDSYHVIDNGQGELIPKAISEMIKEIKKTVENLRIEALKPNTNV